MKARAVALNHTAATSSSGASQDLRTRERVLEAATRQFAESGFKRVTVRAICHEAKANVAAVNYHFRDKLGLYNEVLGQGVALMRALTEEARRATEGLPPAEQLRTYIRVVTERMYASVNGSDSWLSQLFNREMTDPTPMASTLVDEGVRPRLELLSEIVKRLLDRPDDHAAVMLCVTSIHAQIIMFRPSPLAEQVRARLGLPKLSPAEIADHIYAFSLAGIKAV